MSTADHLTAGRGTGAGEKGQFHIRENLIVSMKSVGFSEMTDGYVEVFPGIFFSNLVYLLFVQNIRGGMDFEKAKYHAGESLVLEMKRIRGSLQDGGVTGRSRKRLILLDRAIAVLEEGFRDSR
jgi:hypothetical protein